MHRHRRRCENLRDAWANAVARALRRVRRTENTCLAATDQKIAKISRGHNTGMRAVVLLVALAATLSFVAAEQGVISAAAGAPANGCNVVRLA